MNIFKKTERLKEVRYKIISNKNFDKNCFSIEINGGSYSPNARMDFYLCPLQLTSILYCVITIEDEKMDKFFLEGKIFLEMIDDFNKDKIVNFLEEIISGFNDKYKEVIEEYLISYEKELSYL